MSHPQITSIGDAPAVVLTRVALETLGLGVGDEIEMVVEEGKVVLRSSSSAPSSVEEEAKMDAIMDNLLERRSHLYERLAEGAM